MKDSTLFDAHIHHLLHDMLRSVWIVTQYDYRQQGIQDVKYISSDIPALGFGSWTIFHVKITPFFFVFSFCPGLLKSLFISLTTRYPFIDAEPDRSFRICSLLSLFCSLERTKIVHLIRYNRLRKHLCSTVTEQALLANDAWRIHRRPLRNAR